LPPATLSEQRSISATSAPPRPSTGVVCAAAFHRINTDQRPAENKDETASIDTYKVERDLRDATLVIAPGLFCCSRHLHRHRGRIRDLKFSSPAEIDDIELACLLRAAGSAVGLRWTQRRSADPAMKY